MLCVEDMVVEGKDGGLMWGMIVPLAVTAAKVGLQLTSATAPFIEHSIHSECPI